MRKFMLPLFGIAASPGLLWLGAYGLFALRPVEELTDPIEQATAVVLRAGSLISIFASVVLLIGSVIFIVIRLEKDDEQ